MTVSQVPHAPARGIALGGTVHLVFCPMALPRAVQWGCPARGPPELQSPCPCLGVPIFSPMFLKALDSGSEPVTQPEPWHSDPFSVLTPPPQDWRQTAPGSTLPWPGH